MHPAGPRDAAASGTVLRRAAGVRAISAISTVSALAGADEILACLPHCAGPGGGLGFAFDDRGGADASAGEMLVAW